MKFGDFRENINNRHEQALTQCVLKVLVDVAVCEPFIL